MHPPCAEKDRAQFLADFTDLGVGGTRPTRPSSVRRSTDRRASVFSEGQFWNPDLF